MWDKLGTSIGDLLSEKQNKQYVIFFKKQILRYWINCFMGHLPDSVTKQSESF